MNLSPVLRQRYFDANGLPLAGGLLYSYAAGTSTPQGTYSNSTGTTNANPVVLDANGYADVWIDPSLAYKFVLEDSGSNVLWSVDNVSFPAGISTWSINTSYSQGQLVADGSGQGLLYVSLTNANQGNALTSVANWRIFGGNVTSVSVNTTLTVTHELVRSNSTSGALTHTLPACSTTPIGKKITIKDVGTGGFTTSVKGNGTDVIDGVVTYATALAKYDSLTVVNNGSSWDALLMLADGAVTTAKLAANAVTSAKIAAGAVTQAALASRATGTTVAAGGVAISASCGNFSTTSTTSVDVTNLSVTITTTGRPIMVHFSGSGSSTSDLLSPVGDVIFVNILQGATVIAAFFADGTECRNPSLFPFVVDPQVAGTYTYKVQAHVGSGTGQVNNYKLVAYEL